MEYVTSLLATLGSFVLVLGILVFVHELGHFIVAKSFGIAVQVFSLGFGPRLAGFVRGGTDYRVSLIPLGGYVRMLGEEPDDERTGNPDEFLSRPRWQRFLVFLAGAVFNIILALLLTWYVLWTYGLPEAISTDEYPVVASIRDGSPASESGLRVGDVVVSVGGKDIRDPQIAEDEITLSPGVTKAVVVERNGERLTLDVNMGADPRWHLGSPGWVFHRAPPVISAVQPGMPAEAAGIRLEDRILAVGDREPVSRAEFIEILTRSPGEEIQLKILRGDDEIQVAVTPEAVGDKGMIGVEVFDGNLVFHEYGFWAAGAASVKLNLELAQTVFKTLRRLVRRDISLRALSGPVEIAQFSRRAVQSLRSFLSFLAFISLQLGILNLLPIPVLDGGHILILGVEAGIRRDLSDRIKERVMQAGLVFLLAFFGVVIYLDVIKAWFT